MATIVIAKGVPPRSTAPAKAGGGKNTAAIQQPAFDSRIQFSLPAPFGSGATQLQRGFIMWDPNLMAHQGGTAYINFLYNPSTVSASYSISNSTATAALIFPTTQGGPAAAPVQRVPLQQQIGFTIMFDRTYEMVYGTGGDTVQKLGCEVDVLMMKQLTGMFLQTYKGNNPYIDPTSGNTVGGIGPGATGPTANVNAFSATGVSQGVMQMTFCYVYFGDPKQGLRYYGYIDSWDVSYTHFNNHMIPVRCVVDVSFSLLPPPVNNTPPAAAALTAAQQLANAIATHIHKPGPI